MLVRDGVRESAVPENDGEPDHVLQTCILVPIYSRQLRMALQGGGIQGIQYLPIRVVRPSGELIRGFSVANILNCVDALDLRLSVVARYPKDYFLPSRRGLVSSVNHPVLIRSAVVDYDIMPLSVFTPSVYVSDRFVRIFQDGRFTGYSFREVPTAGDELTFPQSALT